MGQPARARSVSAREVPAAVVAEAIAYVAQQEFSRGAWARPRATFGDLITGDVPVPPYPRPDSPMLRFLMEHAQTLLDLGPLDEALVWLAVHCWMEGHVEGFDRASALYTDPRSSD